MQALQDKVVFAKVNGWEDTLMSKQWGIRGYPTLILMTSDGSEIDRIARFATPPDFLETIADYMAGRGTLDDLRARFAAHSDSLSLLMQIAEKYQYRGRDHEAESCYVAVLQADPSNQSKRADTILHSLARVAYGGGEKRYDTAAARFAALIERYPESPLAEDAGTWVPYIYAKQEKYAKALVLYEAFVKQYPESGEVDWVHIQIDDNKEKGY